MGKWMTTGSTIGTAAVRAIFIVIGTVLIVGFFEYADLRDDVKAGTMSRGDAIEEAIFDGLRYAAIPALIRFVGEGGVDVKRQISGQQSGGDVQPGAAGNP